MPEEQNQSFPNQPASNLDIELLKKEVGLQFPYYDIKYDLNTAVFFCRIDETDSEEKFNLLRKSLSEKGYIPMLRLEHGEHLLYVIKKPKIKKKPVWINYLLFIATVITTTLAGSYLWTGIYNKDWTKMVSPNYMLQGLIFFSIPLLLILGIHEMGHYYASKKHNVEASLPFFIPLPPPIFTLGTFGALISTREPIPDRKSLMDIGAAGPICGFIVAIPVILLGFYFMQQNPIISTNTDSGVQILLPIVVQFFSSFFTIPANAALHPTAFAGWVGLFVTGLNLLPIGQLDGGHVSRALFKEKSKYITWAAIALIIGLSFFYTGFFIVAIIVIFLLGTQHPAPLNELNPLDNKRIAIGIIAILIFILCFTTVPM